MMIVMHRLCFPEEHEVQDAHLLCEKVIACVYMHHNATGSYTYHALSLLGFFANFFS